MGFFKFLADLFRSADPSVQNGVYREPELPLSGQSGPDLDPGCELAAAEPGSGEPAGEGVRGDRLQNAASGRGFRKGFASEAVPRRQLVIGLDFGTSSSKVAFRWLGDKAALVFANPVEDGSPHWFCTPTTLELRNGRAFFGRAAATPSGPCLKLDLLESDSGEGEWGDPEIRAAAYLGWILEEVTQRACAEYSVAAFRPILNVGAPVAYSSGHGESASVRERYRRVATAALASTSMMGGSPLRNDVSWEEARASVLSRTEQAGELSSSVHVLPESIAAVVSYEKDLRSDAGVFSIVDIGAGTTEVAVGVLSRHLGKAHVQCYEDATSKNGAWKLQGADEAGASRLLHGWWRQWEIAWEKGRRKDHANPAKARDWEETKLLFTGGGGLDPRVKEHFENQEPPAILHFGMYQPEREVLRECGGSSGERRGFHLLAVAHGLAYHRKSEWPPWYAPDEIDPEEPDTPEDPEYTAKGWLGR